jgi:thioredoxin 1
MEMADRELEKIKMEKARELLRELSMPKTIITLNTIQQYRELIENNPDKLIVIDFWAEWCAPCKMFAPIFEKLHQEYSTKSIFAKVNVDINQGLAQQYRITGIPTTLFVKHGNIVHKIVGATNYTKMKETLDKFS